MKNPYLLKKFLLSCIPAFCLLFAFTNAEATHIAGADITYKHVNGNTYEVTLTYYFDCVSPSQPIPETLRFRSLSCGFDFSRVLPLVAGSGQEITLPCASGSGTTCSGGGTFGVRKYAYRDTVTLPGACSDWVFSWSRCCRNCAITTTIHGNCGISGGNDQQSAIYIESKLDNLNVADNNSPTFSNDPVATVCIGQSFVYNHGVVDTDGDVLVYSIIGSQVDPGTTVTYQPGYSAANPINSIPALTIDPFNGDLTMNAQVVEIGVMAVKIDEYRNGMLIGSVMRDMQFITQTCNNTLPTATGINGTTTVDTTVCPGTQLCFYVFTNDADAGQFVSLSTNNAIPGSVFNNSGGGHPTGAFCWTPTPADARSTPWTFTVTVRDDACPTNGSQTYAFSITVPEINTSTVAFDAAGDIDLTVSGNSSPYTYQWSNGETTEDITGQSPGIYTVTVCDVNGCCVTTQDTLNTPANCTFPVSAQVHNPTCGGECNGWIKLTPHGLAPYTYQWSNGATTKDIYDLCSATYTFTVTDANGCTYSCHKTVCGPAPLNVSCSGNNTCQGGSFGTASVTVSGGKAPYQYLWDNGAVTPSLTGLCKGTYCVVVTDANGCSDSCCVCITEFQAISLTTVVFNATGSSVCDGHINASAVNGTPPYSFNWSTGSLATGVLSDSIANLCPANYTVTVTDMNGCSRKTTKTVGPVKGKCFTDRDVRINGNSARLQDNASDEARLTVLAVPNPFTNDFTIQKSNESPFFVRIYNMNGAVVAEYKDIFNDERIGADLAGGLYILEIQQAGQLVYQRIAKQDQ